MRTLNPASRDFVEALRKFHLWFALGNMDIRHRYKRSVLGPFWITINMGALIFGVGYIYANVFDSVRSSYIPYLAAGIITWNFVSASLNEGASALIAAGRVLRNVTISKHIYIFHSIWRNIIIMIHNIMIIIPIYFIYNAFPGPGAILVFPGIILLGLFLLASSMFLSVVSAYYRDIPPAVAGVLQLAFFATPIIWEAGNLTRHQWVVTFNPFFHLIECMRAPLLHGFLPITSVVVAIGLTVVMAALAFVTYAKAHGKIVFWI